MSRPTVPDIIEDEGGEEAQGQELISTSLPISFIFVESGFLTHIRLIDKLNHIHPRAMPSSIVEVLPAPVARRIEGLKGVHAEYTKLEHELKREMLELEKKVRLATPHLRYLLTNYLIFR
jgi:nucleosome assembly protein 1-like 1